LHVFNKFFKIKDKFSNLKHRHFQWEDEKYSNFMIDMFISLEPRFEHPGTVVLDELEEAAEVLFFREGSFKIGFEINGKRFFVLKFKNAIIHNEGF